MAKVQAPEWYKSIPAERAGYWSEGDNRMKLAGQATYGKQARLVLKDGTVIDGTVGEERNRWDAKHALAVRIPGRKTQKWIPVREIKTVWADKGQSIVEMLTKLLTEQHA